MPTFEALAPILVDGEPHDPGDTFDAEGEDAKRLSERPALARAVVPPKPPSAPPKSPTPPPPDDNTEGDS